jgi:PKD repeat protein
MRSVPSITIPLWSIEFSPPAADCQGMAGADTAKFKIVVGNAVAMESPVCSFTWTPAADGTVAFDSSASVDPDGAIVSWAWDFGDGATSAEQHPSHQFAAGAYDVCLAVTDDLGLTDACCRTIEVRSLCFEVMGGRWHMIALPCRPFDPDPWEVFDELRPPTRPEYYLNGCLHRYQHDEQRYVPYYREAPEIPFGEVAPCEGYWLWAHEDVTICYEAVCSGDPEVCTFPTEGWYLGGSPQAADWHVDETLWYRGGEGPYPFSAVMSQWVQNPLIYWLPSGIRYASCGLPLEQCDDDHLREFRGHWIYTYEDDVTVEVGSE